MVAATACAAATGATRCASTLRPAAGNQPLFLGTGIKGAMPVRRVAPRRAAVRVQAMIPNADPSALDHVAAQLTPLLYTLADAAPAAEVAAPERQTGPLTPLANVFESVLKLLDQGLESAHVPYSYGFAIIMLTILVKAATFPLTKKQVESTMAMQTIQPRVKELQERYKNDNERLQMETARLYKDAGVNPLAGCLPTIATIPVFIGLYRALSNAADDGLLTESFFWIPSLGGPTTIAARNAGSGSNWLFPLVDGHPPIGWHDALCYLVLPVVLVISQSVSQRIMQPQQQTTDPAQQQTQAILKFLPLMIGWFSLNVPSGLTLYWITNNILTTAQSVFLRKTTPDSVKALAENVPMGATTIVKEKPAEAEKKMTGKEMGSRKKKGSKFKELQAKEKGATFAALKAAEQAADKISDKSDAEPAQQVDAEIVTDSVDQK
eukprot:jgi/Tetstr1/429270/TSEL_019188.t1